MILVVAALASSALVGGVLALVRGLVGSPRSLESVVVDLHRHRSDDSGTETSPLLVALAGRTSASRQADLAVCERDTARWVLDRVKWAALGATFAMATVVVVPLAAGVVTGLHWLAIAIILGGVAGWMWAVVDLRSDAAKARRRMRHAVASYLELVSILMAGGAGPESALALAAEIGQGSAFGHIRSALAAAQIRQEPPWTQFGAVGHRLGVQELIELVPAMSLAGSGAQVRETLATKAASIRFKDTTQVEADMQSKSETMALPVVMMFAGFLILLGYPSLAALATP